LSEVEGDRIDDPSDTECEWEEEVEPSAVDDCIWTQILSSTQDAPLPSRRTLPRNREVETRVNDDVNLFIDLTCDPLPRTSLHTVNPKPCQDRGVTVGRRDGDIIGVDMEDIEDFEDDSFPDTVDVCTFPEPALAKHFR